MYYYLLIGLFLFMNSCSTTDDQLESSALRISMRNTVNHAFDQMVYNAQQRERLIGTIYFPYDKSDIPTQERQKLIQIAQRLKDYEGTVVLEGHTDHYNTDEFNKTLGYKRALSVADYLRSAGVWDERIHIQSFGETRPIASNWDEADRAHNRRVDVIVHATGEGMSGREALRANEKMFQDKKQNNSRQSGINLFAENISN